jgi:hypothetical protein
MLRRRELLAAALVGVAVGFRPTSILFLVPLLLFLWRERREWKPLLRCAAAGIGVATAAYAPALLAQGIPVSFAAASLPRSTRLLIAAYNGSQLFGVAGWIAVLLAAGAAFRRRAWKKPVSLPRSLLWFHATVIALWLLLFLLLPDEEEYLLPLLPSAVILLDRVLGARAFTAVVITLLLFHLVRIEPLGGDSGSRTPAVSIAAGYTVADVRDRLFKLSVRDALHRARVQTPTVLFFGELWIPVRNSDWKRAAPDGLIAHRSTPLFLSAPRPDPAALRRLREQGYRLVVWKYDKWAFERSGSAEWRSLVDVVDRLEDVIGGPLTGAPLSVH